MNVAIIDSGIDRRYVDKIEYGINFLEDKEGKILINNNIEDENGHGTFIYKILEKSCQDINNYYIFKILNKQKECNSALLLEALKYILKFEIKIVILCLATDIYTKELKDIINEIYKKNIVVVSSLKNKSINSYPAVFKHVIGVKGEILQNENFYIYSKGAIQIISSDLSLYGFDSKNHLYRFGGNSKATALFSGILINIIQSKDSQEEVQRKIILNSQKNIGKFERNCKKVNEQVIRILYQKTWYLHKISYENFTTKSIWEMFNNIETMERFLKEIFSYCGVELQDVIIYERDFVSIYDLVGRNV